MSLFHYFPRFALLFLAFIVAAITYFTVHYSYNSSLVRFSLPGITRCPDANKPLDPLASHSQAAAFNSPSTGLAAAEGSSQNEINANIQGEPYNPPSYPSSPSFSPFPLSNSTHAYQYHLRPPPHESLESRSALPYPRPPSYYSIPLSQFIPEYRPVHPVSSRLWLSVYAVRYDELVGLFHLLSMIHCIPSEGDDNDGNNGNGCRAELMDPNSDDVRSIDDNSPLSTDHVDAEYLMLASGLMCSYTDNENSNKNNNMNAKTDKKSNPRYRAELNGLDVKADIRTNKRGGVEILCFYPRYPLLPPANLQLTLAFHGIPNRRSPSNHSSSPIDNPIDDPIPPIEHLPPSQYQQLKRDVVNSFKRRGIIFDMNNKNNDNNNNNGVRGIAGPTHSQLSAHYRGSVLAERLRHQARERIRLVQSMPGGLLAYPRLMELQLPVYAQYNPIHNAVYCGAPLYNDKSILSISDFIGHHTYIGFDHFVLMDRYGHYREILQPFIDLGLVTYIHTPVHPSWPFAHKFDHLYQLESCRYRHYRSARWLGVFELNEYLLFPEIKYSLLFPPTCLHRGRQPLAEGPPWIYRMNGDGAFELDTLATTYATTVERPNYSIQLRRPRLALDRSLAAHPLAVRLAPGAVHTVDALTYERAFPSGCRSLLTDFLVESSLFDTARVSSQRLAVAVSVQRALHRSPSFYRAYGRSLNHSAHGIDIHEFPFPLVKTFTYGVAGRPVKSILRADSPCRIGLNIPHSCSPDLYEYPSTAKEILDYPRISIRRAFFFHYENSDSHHQIQHTMQGHDEEDEENNDNDNTNDNDGDDTNNISSKKKKERIVDRAYDRTRAIFNRNRRHFDGLVDWDQRKYLSVEDRLWGRGVGYTGAAGQIYEAMKAFRSTKEEIFMGQPMDNIDGDGV